MSKLNKNILNKININHLSYSDYIGGAAIAAENINKSFKQRIKSRLFSLNNKKNKNSLYLKIILYLRVFLGKLPKFFYLNYLKHHQSFAFIPSNFPKKLNKISNRFTITNLHWINRETISINDIYKIKSKIVWTCHDMWPFSGSFHLPIDKKKDLIDFDFWIKNKKKKLINKKNIYFVAPSNWIRDKILDSKLVNKKKIKVIGNPIDTKFWLTKNKFKSLKYLNLSKNIKYIIFGGTNVFNDKNKGADLVIDILNRLKKRSKIKFKALFFGSKQVPNKKIFFPYKNYGVIKDRTLLKHIYSVGTCALVASRFESFCQVAAEAQSCGLPVIGYKTSGLIDVVKNNYSGFLVENYDTSLFVNKLIHLLKFNKKHKIMSQNSRKHVTKNFSFNVISKKYINFYLKILENEKL